MSMKTEGRRGLIKALSLVGALAAFAAGSPTASADFVYDFSGNGPSFGNVSHNNSTDAGTGSQYTMTVTDAGGGQVAFTFRNNGPAQSTIANVYFADGPFLLDPPAITTTGDVAFNENKVSPGSLPAAPSTFVTTEEYDAQANNPNPSNGIDWVPGDPNNGIDSLTLTFTLASGKTFADVISALSNSGGPSGTPSLQVGIHVINFASGGSESFIDNPGVTPNTVVPAPSSLVLMGLSSLGLGLFGVRRRMQLAR